MKEGLIYGLFGGVIGSLYMGWVCAPKYNRDSRSYLAVVDIQELISKKSEQLAKGHMPEEYFSKMQTSSTGGGGASTHMSSAHVSLDAFRLQEAADCLKEDLNTFAMAHNLTLLAKNAVVGGNLPDKTAEVLALIEERKEP